MKFLLQITIIFLLAIHIAVFTLLFSPKEKLLALSIKNNAEYVYIDQMPEYLPQVFIGKDNEIKINSADGFISSISTSILNFRMKKIFDDKMLAEMYLNTIDFGGGVVGIESASQYYYKKSAKDLSMEECLTLSGIQKVFK